MPYHRKAPAASEDGRKASYDTIGTIPKIGAQTSAEIPGNVEAYIARSTAEATAFRRRGEAAFSSERYSESVRAFTVAIDIVKKLWQEENVAGVVRSSKLGRALARLLFRRGSARLRLGGEDREAVHDLDQSLTLEPAQPLAFLQKGQALLNMQEHAGASRAFLGGLNIEPGHSDLKRLFHHSIRGVQGSSQRYVPGWRGMGGDRPANGADDGWIPHKLPSQQEVHLVDPCDSREDPVVCAALIEAAVFIDLGDVFETEQDFWKKHGVSVKAEDLRRRMQLVLEDFRDVLSALFSEYCRRQSGPAQPVVARPTNLSQPVAEDANNSQGQPAGVGSVAGDDDSQTSTSGESKNDRSIASSRSFDNADSADTSAVEQPCVPATPSATGSYPGLLGTDECPTRLQRGGSPIGRHHTDRAKLSPVRTKKEASGFKGVGGIADGVLARSGCGREGGVGVHQTLVEQLSMTGAQFLDLVKNCAVLEGRFGWEEAARAVHQVCRSGREAKKLYSEEILRGRAIHGDANYPPKTRQATRRKQGVAGPSVGGPRRPQAERGKYAPRKDRVRPSSAKVARNKDDDKDDPVPLHDGEGRRDKAGEGREKTPEEPDEAYGEQRPAELSKEAAFLKVAEVTEGGQGAMLFPEFVEAITRMCLARYGPWAAPRNQGSVAPSVVKTGKGPACGGVGWRRTSELRFGAEPFARRRKGLAGSTTTPSHARTPKESRPLSVGLAIAHHRLRFAFEQHLLPEVVNACRAPTRRSNQEIADIMEVYAPRLNKIMEFFAVGGPSTAPPLAAASTPTTMPRPKRQPSKARNADVTGSSDLSTSRDGDDSSSSSDNNSESDDDDEDDDVGRPPNLAVEFPSGRPDPSGIGVARDRSHACRASMRRRRPRPPAAKGKECRLSVREFVGMLRSLGTLDSRLTIREACRIFATVVGFVALANAREAPSPQRHGDVGLSNRLKAGDEEKEALLSIGDDAMGPEEFARAVFHCGDLKTWDGMCPVSQRVGLFVVHDLFEQFLEKTGEASVWWTRDNSKPRS